MQNFGHLRPGEFRAPETEILPDGRKRLTRFFEVTHKSKIPKELDQRFNTLDVGVTPVVGWDGLRLTAKKITDMGSGQQGADARPVLQLTFEEIDETAETQVGEANITRLEDGRSAFVLDWLQFADKEDGTFNPTTPRVVGTSIVISGKTAYLLKEEAPDDGCLRHIRRTYVTSGIIATDFQTKENGRLLIQSITSVHDVPETPTGFILIGEPVQNPLGLPGYTYTFAKGNGEISREIRYSQSSDEGVTGATIITIRHLTDPSIDVNPITPPAGMALIMLEKAESDGYRTWTAVYAGGTGMVSDSIEWKNGGKLVIYHRGSLGVAPSAPAATIGGTVTLISEGSRKDSGYEVFESTWAEGNGEISVDVDYSQSVDLGVTGVTRTTIRYLTALSVVLDPTSATGSVNIGVSFALQDGYKLWTSVYAKGIGTVDSRDATREDGSFVYNRTTLSVAASVPAAPAGSYLVDLSQNPSNGYFMNRATFIKPPPTLTFRRSDKYPYPGLAYFVGTDLILQPPTTRILLFSVEVSFATAQDTTVPFSVSTWGAMTETYVQTSNGQIINKQWGLEGYLCAGVTLSGSGVYKGVPVDSYSVTRFASNPAAMPTGATLVSVDNTPYLAALDGTIIYKRTKTTVTL